MKKLEDLEKLCDLVDCHLGFVNDFINEFKEYKELGFEKMKEKYGYLSIYENEEKFLSHLELSYKGCLVGLHSLFNDFDLLNLKDKVNL